MVLIDTVAPTGCGRCRFVNKSNMKCTLSSNTLNVKKYVVRNHRYISDHDLDVSLKPDECPIHITGTCDTCESCNDENEIVYCESWNHYTSRDGFCFKWSNRR